MNRGHSGAPGSSGHDPARHGQRAAPEPTTAGNGPGGPAAASPHRTLQPAGWPRPRGYANGIAARGTQLHIAGQVGWDPLTESVIAGGFAAQCAQALENIVAILQCAGAGPQHVVRLTWYVTDTAEYAAASAEVGRSFRRLFGSHYPAMSLVQVAALLEPGARVEIEATAVLPDTPPP